METNKERILIHYKRSIDYVISLKKLSESEWRTPIAEGKWTIAEVVGHLAPWDQFVLEERLPFFFKTEDLPPGPKAEDINQVAALKSRQLTKEAVIDQFVEVRESLIESLGTIDVDLWEKPFQLGSSRQTLFGYFMGLMGHDDHHFSQIEQILKR